MKIKLIVIAIITIISAFFLYPRKEKLENLDEYGDINAFKVVVSGAVVFPGEYVFYEPVRIKEIIELAGGYLYTNEKYNINEQKQISSDYELRVANKKEDEISILKVNVNNASFQELILVPGITETRAASIIVYREANGMFQNLDELINVKNIGPATLDKIKTYLTC